MPNIFPARTAAEQDAISKKARRALAGDPGLVVSAEKRRIRVRGRRVGAADARRMAVEANTAMRRGQSYDD